MRRLAIRRTSNANRWTEHPAVSSNLLFREKAAELLKRGFGTWTALGSVGLSIVAWMFLQHIPTLKFDPYPYILLNLCLSMLAAVQGIILQISANRGDRVSSEVALHTAKTADTMLILQNEQTEILRSLKHVNSELDLIKEYFGVVPDGRCSCSEGNSLLPDALPSTPSEE